MPARAADLDEALKKKGGLTLSQLANYDDLITDALVDRVYFWAAIRKLKPNFHASRGIQEEKVCSIIQEDVIINKDPVQAHRNLLRLSGIANYLRSLRTQDEREHFERHLRKYINMYLPECPFEVCTTNRYTILTHEACVIARRPINIGEPIKFLSGIQVEMTEKEEEELSSRTDFSIVISSRRKRPSLFLGPARFANHDCDSNARLSTSGPHGIHIVARKYIQEGDEITVQYGDNYFGENNCECLCASCEKAVRNGWDPKGPVLPDSSSDDEAEEKPSRKATPKAKPVPRPQKRKRGEETLKVESEEPELPRKRGRWATKESQPQLQTMGRPAKEKQAISGAKANGTSTQASQSIMADWFAKRSNGELEDEVMEDVVNIDGDEGDETLADLHEKFNIRKRAPQTRSPGQRPSKAEKRGAFGRMIDLITGATSRDIDRITQEIQAMNAQTAELMDVDVEDVPKHYTRSSKREQEVQTASIGMSKASGKTGSIEKTKSGAKLSRIENTETGANSSRAGVKKTEMSSGDDLPEEQQDSSDLGDFLSPGRLQWFNGCVKDVMGKAQGGAPLPRDESYASYKEKQAKEDLQKQGEAQRKTKTSKVTDKFAQAKTTPAALKSSHSKSNLRNVQNADDEDERDIYEVPESPEPAQAPKRGRGRPRKHPRKSAARYDSAQGLEATQTSTDSSSMSSVFSSTEGGAGEASSLTSTDQSPDRLAGFAAGNICQNIVEMYTTEPSPVNADWEEERKMSDQRLKGWARGRLPVRKSSRRALLPEASTQAITSIEPAQVKQEDDEEDCKRGSVRTPGDYHLTTALLCTTYHRWVECRNCDEFFVQAEAYLTRIACPRCERHSKLYGYHWPKTDREGKHDTEERVLDHRTIHRFIDPEDERMEKKGKKGLAEVIRERETSSRLQSEGLSESRVERLRNSPRRSESRRKTRRSNALG